MAVRRAERRWTASKVFWRVGRPVAAEGGAWRGQASVCVCVYCVTTYITSTPTPSGAVSPTQQPAQHQPVLHACSLALSLPSLHPSLFLFDSTSLRPLSSPPRAPTTTRISGSILRAAPGTRISLLAELATRPSRHGPRQWKEAYGCRQGCGCKDDRCKAPWRRQLQGRSHWRYVCLP